MLQEPSEKYVLGFEFIIRIHFVRRFLRGHTKVPITQGVQDKSLDRSFNTYVNKTKHSGTKRETGLIYWRYN